MNTIGLVIELVSACAGGRLRAADCGPVWHLGIIAALVAVLVVTLLVLRLRAHLQPEKT